MNFFLGIFPDKKTVQDIRKVSSEIESVFEGFDIPVRWSEPDNYHLSVVYLGNRFSFIDKIFLTRRFKKISFRSFNIKFNTVKLGISRKYKELIYLDLLEGGDDLRKLLLDMRNILKIKNEGNFIPHLTLGRVSKDLTSQEYLNICRDLHTISKNLKIKDVEFIVDDLKLVKSEKDEYYVLMNFKTSSSI